MSWVVVGVSVASSLLSSSGSDKSWKDSARKNGISKAQVAGSRARAQALLPGQTRQLNDEALAASVSNQQQESAALANAAVEAAAAGSAGANVDQTIQSIEGGAARVKGEIEKKRRAGLLQINQDYEDLYWDAKSQEKRVMARGGNNLLGAVGGAIGAGVSAYSANKPVNK